MDIKGTYTLQERLEDVRNSLTDSHVLERTLPGVERLEALGEKNYSIVLNIEHGPLVGRFQGQVAVIEQGNPYHLHFTFDGEGRQSKMSSDWNIVLDRYEEQTIVAYEAKVSTGRATKSMPAPLLKGAIKLLIQEFFTALAQELRPIPSDGVANEEDEQLEAEQPYPSISTSPVPEQPTLAHSIVRRLHLGAGDAGAEEQWVKRIRRFGMTSVMLLLVWIGTRLPRKQ